MKVLQLSQLSSVHSRAVFAANRAKQPSRHSQTRQTLQVVNVATGVNKRALRGPANKDLAPQDSSSLAVELLERSAALPPAESVATPSDTAELVLSQSERSQASSKRQVDESVQLKSTWAHRGWVAAGVLLSSAIAAEGFARVHDASSAASACVAVVAAYLFSDFASGLYHWGVDNYGDANTPVFGSQIEGFQGHHQAPWTITEREFCNNLHKVFAPGAVFSAAWLLAAPWVPAELDIWVGLSTVLVCMSQQFHAWSHMKKSELPEVVVALQDAGVLISRKAHGAHHKAPFEGNYSIVSGFWNPILDAGGSDDGFFRRLERFVHRQTGVEPRCWHEPQYSWQEQVADEA